MDRLRRDPRRWTVLGPLRPLGEALSQLSRALQLARTQRGLTAGEFAASREEPRDERDPLRALHGLADPRALPRRPVLLLGSLRSDPLADFERAAPFTASRSRHLSIGPLSESGLLASITGPAGLAGVSFEDGLAQELLADVRERHALPLLAFTLRALWERRTPGERIGRHSYVHDLGRVHGAIRRAAEAASGGAQDEAQWKLLRRALLKMVQVDPDGKLVRRRVQWSEIPPGSEEQLGALVEARLLVRDGGSVEPAHEALFEVWPRLAESVKEAREALMVRGELEADAARWTREKRAPEFLWPRARLEQATGLLSAAELELEPTGQEFTAASWERVKRQEAEDERSR